MEVKEWYAGELMGLSLRNIGIRITDGKRKLYEEFGEMLFTHYGVTGPVILSASSIVGKRLKSSELTLHIDLKPALTEEAAGQKDPAGIRGEPQPAVQEFDGPAVPREAAAGHGGTVRHPGG